MRPKKQPSCFDKLGMRATGTLGQSGAPAGGRDARRLNSHQASIQTSFASI